MNSKCKNSWWNKERRDLKFICIPPEFQTEINSLVSPIWTTLLPPQKWFQKLISHSCYMLIICWTLSLWTAGVKMQSYSSRNIKYLSFLSLLDKTTSQNAYLLKFYNWKIFSLCNFFIAFLLLEKIKYNKSQHTSGHKWYSLDLGR